MSKILDAAKDHPPFPDPKTQKVYEDITTILEKLPNDQSRSKVVKGVRDQLAIEKEIREPKEFFFKNFLNSLKTVFNNLHPDALKKFTALTNDQALRGVIKTFQDSRILLTDQPVVDIEQDSIIKLFDEPLDLPFKVCYFERRDDNYIWNMLNQEDDRVLEVQSCFVLVEENGPNHYSIIGLGMVNNKFSLLTYGDDVRATGLSVEDIVTKKNGWLKCMVRFICDDMKKSATATERINVRQKERIAGEKIQHKIREVIHIVPKKVTTFKKVEEHSEVDWSHRWEVRGHWRKTDTIGKDRTGAYNVNGYTWVVPHEKGPDGKPLVKKIRNFKSEVLNVEHPNNEQVCTSEV